MSEEKKNSVVGAPAIDLEASIVEDLGAREAAPATEAPQTEEPTPAFDITQMSHEQLQALKAQLAATPDRLDRKHKNNTIKLRTVNDQIVVDFKNAFLGMVDDEERQRKVERHIIPVKLEGADDFKNMLYKEFMASDHIIAEVLRINKVDVPIIEGETLDPYGQLVEMVRTEVEYTFDLKLPDGRDLQVPGKIVNA